MRTNSDGQMAFIFEEIPTTREIESYPDIEFDFTSLFSSDIEDVYKRQRIQCGKSSADAER